MPLPKDESVPPGRCYVVEHGKPCLALTREEWHRVCDHHFELKRHRRQAERLRWAELQARAMDDDTEPAAGPAER